VADGFFVLLTVGCFAALAFLATGFEKLRKEASDE